ncbi:MAG: polysaccharide biosynthesis/export family protein [Desulfomonile tiedjei]|uniref:Polysaccharide biosynthesis/export family protein n=1 Tax=Desulfomonile tiedjei TaxID=2358 RepID=A0A9D6V5P0_9BACT|nr:polysaccharide biosynthesis/export family protein [Desulfomonile tiedjei]
MRTRHSHKFLRAPVRLMTVLLILVFMMGGCVIPRHRGVVNETPLIPQCRITEHFPASLYRLAAGDVLEFLYLTIPGVTATPYKISIRDMIDVEFSYHPELNRSVRVRPDGRISIPRKEDVYIAGMTADQVSKMLKKVYSDLLKDPEITVTVREFNAKLDEIQKAISTAPNGQARVITIAPDGHIALPLITDLKVEGVTLPDLTQEVNKRYASILPDIKVSVILKEVTGNLIFVDGEVSRPGVFNVRGPTTVQQAIALAGGTRETAEPRTVLVVTKTREGKFLSRTTDLTRMTSASDYSLKQGDLIYVPMSTISRADVWVDQNIRKLLVFTGWSLGINTDLGRTVGR